MCLAIPSQITEINDQMATIDVDGVRVLFDHGWGLLRASNTQPALVLRFEAETKEQLEEYRHIIEESVARLRD